MRFSDAEVLVALARAGWSQTGADALLGVRPGYVAARVSRSDVLSAAWRENARRTHRSGRPPSHEVLTLGEVRAAIATHGTKKAAARALGVSHQAVSAWTVRHGVAVGSLDCERAAPAAGGDFMVMDDVPRAFTREQYDFLLDCARARKAGT